MPPRLPRISFFQFTVQLHKFWQKFCAVASRNMRVFIFCDSSCGSSVAVIQCIFISRHFMCDKKSHAVFVVSANDMLAVLIVKVSKKWMNGLVVDFDENAFLRNNLWSASILHRVSSSTYLMFVHGTAMRLLAVKVYTDHSTRYHQLFFGKRCCLTRQKFSSVFNKRTITQHSCTCYLLLYTLLVFL